MCSSCTPISLIGNSHDKLSNSIAAAYRKQPSLWTPPKMRFGLSSLFLIWLCITLLFATAHTEADVIRPNGIERKDQFDYYFAEYRERYEEEVKSRRVTMIGMIVVLIAMFAAMRKMLKNEEARRRQIWEPVDSSAEASILRRLAEDTQRRVAGGWGQISESLVEGGNAATAAVGTAFTRIRNNVRNATGSRPEDCDDNLEMLPNGRRAQTRRELEADMRDFLLEADDEEEDEDQIRDEDGLLARHRSSSSSGSSSSHPRQTAGGSNMISSVSPPLPSSRLNGSGSNAESFPDEPPSYDEIRVNNNQGGPTSIAAGLNISHLTPSSSS
ncbi:hypothetical protein EC991_010295 [Linnemannia zychae]|nr:hypothetical protein EC991_010295 [Linnemannia zychae]